MRTSSTGFLILSVTWIVVSLLWFFWVKNPAIWCVWLCVGIAALVIALISGKKNGKGS